MEAAAAQDEGCACTIPQKKTVHGGSCMQQDRLIDGALSQTLTATAEPSCTATRTLDRMLSTPDTSMSERSAFMRALCRMSWRKRETRWKCCFMSVASTISMTILRNHGSSSASCEEPLKKLHLSWWMVLQPVHGLDPAIVLVHLIARSAGNLGAL